MASGRIEPQHEGKQATKYQEEREKELRRKKKKEGERERRGEIEGKSETVIYTYM